nr:MerR family transcriptional regulator [uncultured Acetatifactor sp.]
MTIREVCDKYDISQDTLRYYERVGVIPQVNRTSGGIRDYKQQDLDWIENAVCMRNAGVSIETIIEYVGLFLEGDATINARLRLLEDELEQLNSKREQLDQAISKLKFKVSRYKIAAETGILSWEENLNESVND